MHARPVCMLLACVVHTSSCDDEDGTCSPSSLAECVATLPDECTPLYAPTFDNAFDNTFSRTCASVDQPGSCHATPGSEGATLGGLVFRDREEAYSILRGDAGKVYVEPGDPSCSLLMRRLEVACDELRMPPGGTPLDDKERCSIMQWIEQGAQR